MRETWVRPPLVAREPAPAWVARWRFRLAALLVLAVLVGLGLLLFRQLTGANDQDPGVEAPATEASALVATAVAGPPDAALG